MKEYTTNNQKPIATHFFSIKKLRRESARKIICRHE